MKLRKRSTNFMHTNTNICDAHGNIEGHWGQWPEAVTRAGLLMPIPSLYHADNQSSTETQSQQRAWE